MKQLQACKTTERNNFEKSVLVLVADPLGTLDLIFRASQQKHHLCFSSQYCLASDQLNLPHRREINIT